MFLINQEQLHEHQTTYVRSPVCTNLDTHKDNSKKAIHPESSQKNKATCSFREQNHVLTSASPLVTPSSGNSLVFKKLPGILSRFRNSLHASPSPPTFLYSNGRPGVTASQTGVHSETHREAGLAYVPSSYDACSLLSALTASGTTHGTQPHDAGL